MDFFGKLNYNRAGIIVSGVSMKIPLRTIIFHNVCFFGCLLAARAQSADPIGLASFYAATTNVNGSGITVAQPEAALDSPGSYLQWQVNPAAVGRATNLFTYTSSNGTANVFPNSLGTESTHGDQVGQAFYGIPNGVATNVARVDGFEANYFINTYVFGANSPTSPLIGDPIVNQSFTFGIQTIAGQQQIDSGYDDYSAQNHTLFVSAADNYSTDTNIGSAFSPTVCPPGTSYNCISVGAYQNGVAYNSLGPTADNGRCKPDITAISSETSFSTPQVSGAAAVLMQAALRGDGGNDTNSADDLRTIKALLLNGAVKPAGWTNSMSSPLDARCGAGVLNVLNAYQQLAGGKQGYIASTSVAKGGAHPPNGAPGTIGSLTGWDFNTNSSGITTDVIEHYYFNVTNSASGGTFAATATLVWNRQLHQTGINNLSLFLYNCANSNLVLCSTSLVDNVEHIFVPQLAQGRYDLQVWKAGGIPSAQIVSAAEPYALAWTFVSPTLAIARAGANAAITWPLYPAGFSVQTTTNLLPPVSWSANNLSASAITNGINYLGLNATNPAQFFRLVSP